MSISFSNYMSYALRKSQFFGWRYQICICIRNMLALSTSQQSARESFLISIDNSRVTFYIRKPKHHVNHAQNLLFFQEGKNHEKSCNKMWHTTFSAFLPARKKKQQKKSCNEASWFIHYTTEPFGHHHKSLQILAPVLMENIQFYNNST